MQTTIYNPDSVFRGEVAAQIELGLNDVFIPDIINIIEEYSGDRSVFGRVQKAELDETNALKAVHSKIRNEIQNENRNKLIPDRDRIYRDEAIWIIRVLQGEYDSSTQFYRLLFWFDPDKFIRSMVPTYHLVDRMTDDMNTYGYSLENKPWIYRGITSADIPPAYFENMQKILKCGRRRNRINTARRIAQDPLYYESYQALIGKLQSNLDLGSPEQMAVTDIERKLDEIQELARVPIDKFMSKVPDFVPFDECKGPIDFYEYNSALLHLFFGNLTFELLTLI